MSLVLDSSVTLAWIYMDERTDAITAVFDRVTDSGAWVPALWKLEIANVLEMGVRRGRTDRGFLEATLTDLELLPIQADPDTGKHAWRSTLRLAQRYRLTLYDAAYLELALRRSLPLATLDLELRNAAEAESITLLGQ